MGKIFTVYVLRNSISGKHYIGYTGDLNRRLSEHNSGQTKSTKAIGKWEVVHKEIFISLGDAVRRERLIKSYKGGNAFKELLRR